MTTISSKSVAAAGGRLSAQLLAGISGLAVAALLLAVAVWMQDYTASSFPTVALFVFPAPVACGLTVGLVSPRRAIAWAPLWACVFALLVLAIVSEAIHGLAAHTSAMRMSLFAVGLVLAAASGLLGQYARIRGLTAHAVGILIALCVLMAAAQWAVVSYQQRVFEDTVIPEVQVALNRDYLNIPRGTLWSCSRRPPGSYTITAELDGRPITVIVGADLPNILGVSYKCGTAGRKIADDQDAREYLAELGFRDTLVSSLSRQKGTDGSWCASLGLTRLVLSADGQVNLSPLNCACR